MPARRPGHAAVPNGIRFHVCQVFVEELPAAARESLPDETMMRLLAPFLHIVGRTTDLLLFDHVVSTVFHVMARINDVPTDYMKNDEKIGDQRARSRALCEGGL